MIIKYLIEKMSWIIFILLLQAVSLFVAYVDQAIPFMPVLYIVGINLILLFTFLIINYMRATRFYKSLMTWDHTYDLGELKDAGSPFEHIVEDAIRVQTIRYRQESHTNFFLLEQEKDDLLAWIHEVKTPLTAMKLMIDRQDNGLPVKNELSYEWLRIHHLLDQQLHQKRIPFIKNDLVLRQVKLEAVFNSEIHALRSWCIAKGIGFELDFEVEEVVTDEKWLGFMIRQILTNAVKYSNSSDITIRSFYDKEHVVLSISDLGRGILEKDVSRIFEKGFTSSDGRQQGDATGMGLYLAKQVADALNIQVEVTSLWGEGTTFTFAFSQQNNFVSLHNI